MIKRKKGICVECNKETWLANNALRLCNYHNKIRKMEKKKQKNVERGEDITLTELYQKIWDSRPHKSFLTGKTLDLIPRVFWKNIFCHCLAKGQNQYPKFKLKEYNIILLTPREHFLLDFGTEQSRDQYKTECESQGLPCDWGQIRALQETLKTKYNELDKD